MRRSPPLPTRTTPATIHLVLLAVLCLAAAPLAQAAESCTAISTLVSNTTVLCENGTRFDLTGLHPADGDAFFFKATSTRSFDVQVVGGGLDGCYGASTLRMAKQKDMLTGECIDLCGPLTSATPIEYSMADQTLTFTPGPGFGKRCTVSVRCEDLPVPQLLSTHSEPVNTIAFLIGWQNPVLCATPPPTPAPTPPPTPPPTPAPTNPPHILECLYIGPSPMRLDCEGRLLDLLGLHPAGGPDVFFTGSLQGAPDTKYAARFVQYGLPSTLPAAVVPKCNNLTAGTAFVLGAASDVRCVRAANLNKDNIVSAHYDLQLHQLQLNLTVPSGGWGGGDDDQAQAVSVLTITCAGASPTPRIAKVAAVGGVYLIDIEWNTTQICFPGSTSFAPTQAPTAAPTLLPVPCTLSLDPPMFDCGEGLQLDFSRFTSASGKSYFLTTDSGATYYTQLVGDGVPFGVSQFCQFPLDKVAAVRVDKTTQACRPLGLLDRATNITFQPSTGELSVRFAGGEGGASYTMTVACDPAATKPAITDPTRSSDSDYSTQGKWAATSLCGKPATTSPTPAPTTAPPSPYSGCKYSGGAAAKVTCSSGLEFDLSAFAPDGASGPSFFSATAKDTNTTFFLQVKGSGLAPGDIGSGCAFSADSGVAAVELTRPNPASATCTVLGHMDTEVLVQLKELDPATKSRELILSFYGGEEFRFFTASVTCPASLNATQEHPVLLGPPTQPTTNVYAFELGWRHPDLCAPPTPPPTPAPTPSPTPPPTRSPTEIFISAYTQTDCLLGGSDQDAVVWRVEVLPGEPAKCREDTSARFWPAKRYLSIAVDEAVQSYSDFRADCHDADCADCGLVLPAGKFGLEACMQAAAVGVEPDYGLVSVMVRPRTKPCLGADTVDTQNTSALLAFFASADNCELSAKTPPSVELYTYLANVCAKDNRVPGRFSRLTEPASSGSGKYELVYGCTKTDCTDCIGTLRADETVCEAQPAAHFLFLGQELMACAKQPLTPAPTPSPTPAPSAGPGRWLVTAYTSTDCGLGDQGESGIVWPLMASDVCTADGNGRFWSDSRFYVLKEDAEGRITDFRADCRDKECRECGLTLGGGGGGGGGGSSEVEPAKCHAAAPVNTTAEFGLQAFALRSTGEACVGSDEIHTDQASAVLAYYTQAKNCSLVTGAPNVQLYSYMFDTCLADPRVAGKFYILETAPGDAEVLELAFGCNATCGGCSGTMRGRIGRCVAGVTAGASFQFLSQAKAKCANQPFPPPTPTAAPTVPVPTAAPTIEPGSGAEYFVSLFSGSFTCNLGTGRESALMSSIRNTGGECQLDVFSLVEDTYYSLQVQEGGHGDAAGDGGKVQELRLRCSDAECKTCSYVVKDVPLSSCAAVQVQPPAGAGGGVALPTEDSLVVTAAAQSCVEAKNVTLAGDDATVALVVYPASTECSLSAGFRNAIIATFSTTPSANTSCLHQEGASAQLLGLGDYVRISRAGNVDTLAYKCDKGCSSCSHSLSAVRGRCQPAQLVASDRFEFLPAADLGKACASPSSSRDTTELALIAGVATAGGLLLLVVVVGLVLVHRRRRSGGGEGGGEGEGERRALLGGGHTATSNV